MGAYKNGKESFLSGKTSNGKAMDNGKEAAKRWAFKLNKQAKRR
jgi:hypothetical protein